MSARFLIVAAALSVPAAATADPFNQDEGKGRVILSGIYTSSPTQFDAQGRAIKAPDYNQFNLYALGEYGITDRLNVIVAPSFRSIDIAGKDNDSTGLGYTDLGARYQVTKGDRWVFDIQALVRVPGTGRAVGIAQIGNRDTQTDLRALGGYTFGKSFVSLEGSYRLRSGRPPNEYHADITFGTHPTPKLLLLASVLNTISDGRGSSSPIVLESGTSFNYGYSYRYHDAYVSAVYSLNRHFAVQAGATATLAGRNALRQRGPLIGLWYSF